MSITYQNPVIPGFYPDPSICRVGEDFYLVTSTFEFFPGIPVMHSRDLVHWRTIGHCINRESQFTMATGSQSNTGLYAPTIRHHNGIFYMITTKIGGADGGNFYVWTKNPAGEWSDPVHLPTPGIDPDLFFDDDGTVWQTGTYHKGIYTQQIDLKTGNMVGDLHIIWTGTGAGYSEGPHIYKKDGWYYLLISEGGTERCHMLSMARSRSVTGPYEECPYNPVMTNRSMALPLQAIGHADLVEDQHGMWWAVCLGIREFGYPQKHNLGRETMLVPVDFSGAWPVFGDNGRAMEQFTVPRLPGVSEADPIRDNYNANFSGDEIDDSWNYIYAPGLAEISADALVLTGNGGSLSDAEKIAWVGRRQQHFDSKTHVTLTFPCVQDGEEAGISAFCNNRHHYEAALMHLDGRRQLILRRRIGSLWKIEQQMDWPAESVDLCVSSDVGWYIFSYRTHDGKWAELGRGETGYLTTEVGGAFTGNYIALYCVGNGKACTTAARFKDFSYEAIAD